MTDRDAITRTPAPNQAGELAAHALRQDPDPHPGEWIGPYKLLSVLGEGGFGVVYLAERREPIVRRVAIKIIKPGMDSRAVIARFEQERQALAMMDHPHIARVLDAGTTDRNLPYFVMEFVKGEPITEFCDRQRLGMRERLGLFVQVCDAVHHAHVKGIIHRDLKPSNILITYEGSPQVKVIDFGVAKALNQRLSAHTVVTHRGEMIGTLEYMSPEQAEMSGLDVDARSDIYSLGVILYELLTGLLPFDARTLREKGLSEIQCLIRDREFPRPSTRLSTIGETAQTNARSRKTDVRTLTGILRRELDWVVMKCLEKDRSRRYGTSEALGTDLRRYLNGFPVVARPPSAWYRMSKAVDRSRLLEKLAIGIRATTGIVVVICSVAIVALLVDAGFSLGLFGEYGPEGISLSGALLMNVYGGLLTMVPLTMSFRLARGKIAAGLICTISTGVLAFWAFSILAGWCPYAAGGLLEDDRLRSLFALIYLVIFSVLFFTSGAATGCAVLVDRTGRRRC